MHRKIIPDIVKDQMICALAPEQTARDAAEKMVEHNCAAVVIAGEDGSLQGIVTERDLARKCCAIGADPERTPVSAIMTEAPDTIRPDDDARGGAVEFDSDRSAVVFEDAVSVGVPQPRPGQQRFRLLGVIGVGPD